MEKCHMSPPSACVAGRAPRSCAGSSRRAGTSRGRSGPHPSRDSEPKPEVSVVHGHARQPGKRTPSPRMSPWSSRSPVERPRPRPQSALASTYGAGGIPVYWIMNIKGRQLEVYAHRPGGGSVSSSHDPGRDGLGRARHRGPGCRQDPRGRPAAAARAGGGDMTSQVLAGLLLRQPFQPFRFIGLGKQ